MKSIQIEDLSSKAQERVLKPKFRGRFNAEDSAKTQFGLVTAGGSEGSLYWLVDMDKQRVEDARFLSYGHLSSLPLLDIFSEMVIGKSLDDACHVKAEVLCSELDFEDWDSIETSFIQDLQEKVLVNIQSVVVEAPIEEKDQPYKRKELSEMDEADKAWIPLSAPQKIAALEQAIPKAIEGRSDYQASEVTLFNIERDMQVKVRFSDKVDPQHRPTLVQFITEHCRSELHSQITIEEA